MEEEHDDGVIHPVSLLLSGDVVHDQASSDAEDRYVENPTGNSS